MREKKLGRPFVKGKCKPGPGRPKLGEDLKEARRLNQAEFISILNQYITWTPSKLRKKAENSSTIALHVIVCRLVANAAKNGDLPRLNFILDRLIGKVKEHIEVTSTNTNIELKTVEDIKKQMDEDLKKLNELDG